MQQEQTNYNRRRLMALGALILLILIIVFLIWWWFVPKSSPSPQTGTPIVPPEDRVVLPPQVQSPVAPPPTAAVPSAGEAEVMNLARNFAERYGSWSTDSRYQNLTDLFPTVTERLKQEFRQIIAQAPEQTDFIGIDTRALNVTLPSYSATRARAIVSTQRTERNAELENTVRYENLELSMVKQGQYWFVDSAVWK